MAKKVAKRRKKLKCGLGPRCGVGRISRRTGKFYKAKTRTCRNGKTVKRARRNCKTYKSRRNWKRAGGVLRYGSLTGKNKYTKKYAKYLADNRPLAARPRRRRRPVLIDD